ncbi:MAG: thymidine kinase [Bacilli bacterium]|nr:thymidine kinase [Bacilli bacterium]
MYQEFQKGWIEVITGPMFAGKSEELIRRIRTLRYARKNIICFKPSIDDRYSETSIASHAGGRYKAYPIQKPEEMLNYVTEETDVVAIDEVQFFGESVIPIIDKFASRGIRVMCAGLDMDFRGEPFGVMPTLLAKAEFVTKLSASCKICGDAATRTQRIIDGKPAYYEDPVVLVGASESYEARCRKHHECPHKKQK